MLYVSFFFRSAILLNYQTWIILEGNNIIFYLIINFLIYMNIFCYLNFFTPSSFKIEIFEFSLVVHLYIDFPIKHYIVCIFTCSNV